MGRRSAVCRIQISGDGKSRSEEIDKRSFIIGRSEDADVRIETPGVSRAHLSVEINNNQIWIQDLASANGTKVKGEKLVAKKKVRYNIGDPIILGVANDVVVFTLPGVPQEGNDDVTEITHHAAIKLPPLPVHQKVEMESPKPTISFQAPTIPDIPVVSMPKPAPSASSGATVTAVATTIPSPIKESVKLKDTDPGIDADAELDHTMIDPDFQKRIQAQQREQNSGAQEQVLAEAKGSALRIKIGAETDAAKILQDAKEKALAEISKAKQEADDILRKASEFGGKIQKDGEAEASEMRQAMQATMAKLHAEYEQKTENLRREGRDKGEVIIAEYQARAEKILSTARVTATTIKADAQKEADSILNEAYQKNLEAKNNWEVELKALQKEEKEKIADLIADSQNEADNILQEARVASSLIRRNIEKELREIRSHAEGEAAEIKSDAQIEALDIIAKSRQDIDIKKQELDALKVQGEREIEEIKSQAQAEIAEIRTSAQKEAHEILARARLDADVRKQEIDKLKAKADEEVKEIRAEARARAAEIKASAQTDTDTYLARMRSEIESQKQELLSQATEEAQNIRDAAIRTAKKEGDAILKALENDCHVHRKTLDKLTYEIGQGEKQKTDGTLFNKSLHEKNIALQDEIDKLAHKLQAAQNQAQAKIDDYNNKIADVQEVLKATTAEVDAQRAESQGIRDLVLNAETRLKEAKTQEDNILKYISDLKTQKDVLSEELKVHSQKIEAEKLRRRQEVDKEFHDFKEATSTEIKRLREKTQSDYNQKKTDQETELKKMRMTELETIKGLRAREEASFRAARKKHIVEISNALETYLVPRIKNFTGDGEMPKTLVNFFPELKGIVANVLEGQFADGAPEFVAPGENLTKPNIKLSKRARYIGASAVCTVIALGSFAYFHGGETNRKPASEIFLDHLRQKEAQRPKFNPTMTDDYKSTYADNVLYTKDYVTFKLNPDTQSKWIKDLNKFFVNNLNLNENTIVKFISIESSLIEQLRDLRAVVHPENQKDDIAKMTDLEKNTMPEIISVLGSEKNYRAFRTFEKDYINKGREPASASPTATPED